MSIPKVEKHDGFVRELYPHLSTTLVRSRRAELFSDLSGLQIDTQPFSTKPIWPVLNIPNDLPADASTSAVLTFDTSVSSVSETSNDRDWIRFDASSSQTVTFHIKPFYWRAIYIQLVDENGNVVSDPIVKETGNAYVLDAVFEDAGTYFIEVYSTPGYDDHILDVDYTVVAELSADDLPDDPNDAVLIDIGEVVENRLSANDVDYIRIFLKADTQYFFDVFALEPELFWVDPDTGLASPDGSRTIRRNDGFFVQESGDYIVGLFGDGSAVDYQLIFAQEDPEEGYSIETAGILSFGGPNTTGRTDFAMDRDYYTIEVDQAGLLQISDIKINGLGGSDPDLQLVDKSGNAITLFARNPAGASELFYYYVGPGTYYLEVLANTRVGDYSVRADLNTDVLREFDDELSVILIDGDQNADIAETGYFRIENDANGHVVLELDGPERTQWELFDSAGRIIDDARISFESETQIILRMPEDGIAYVRAELKFGEKYGPATVTLREVTADLEAVWSSSQVINMDTVAKNGGSFSVNSELEIIRTGASEAAILGIVRAPNRSIENDVLVIQHVSQEGASISETVQVSLGDNFNDLESWAISDNGTIWVITTDTSYGSFIDNITATAIQTDGSVTQHDLGAFPDGLYDAIVDEAGNLLLKVRTDKSTVNGPDTTEIFEVSLTDGLVGRTEIFSSSEATLSFEFFRLSDGTIWYYATHRIGSGFDSKLYEQYGQISRRPDGEIQANAVIEGDDLPTGSIFALDDGFIIVSFGRIQTSEGPIREVLGSIYDKDGVLINEWRATLSSFDPVSQIILTEDEQILLTTVSESGARLLRIGIDGTLMENDLLPALSFRGGSEFALVEWGDGTYSIYSYQSNSGFEPDYFQVDQFTFNPDEATPYPFETSTLDDRIYGTDEYDGVYADSGNDEIYLYGGNDLALGGFGDDTIILGEGDDRAEGNPGDDIIFGELGDDTLFGNMGSDALFGGDGRDQVYGGSDNDTLYGDAAIALVSTTLEAQLYRAYAAVFDRAPDAGGFDLFITEMRLGRLSQEDVIAEFVGSAEFAASYGDLDNTAFMQQLYRNVLDREADAGGLAAFVAELDGGRSRASVVVEFANSGEFIQALTIDTAAFASNVILDPAEASVFRLYQAVFDRAPDLGGFDVYTRSIQAGLLDEAYIASDFVASAEFQATYGDLGNADFVSLLFANVLPGNTDQAGRDAYTAALDAGNLSRAEMVAELADSYEFRLATQSAAENFVASVFTDSADTLDGGADDDVLFGGEGADVFVYSAGNDVVLDFQTGSDTLSLTGLGEDFDTAAEVLAAAAQSGNDVVFDFGADFGTLTLMNVQLAALGAEDFVF